ncbi:MAG: ABC transporter substrate-binding protein [Variovorax sp.]
MKLIRNLLCASTLALVAASAVQAQQMDTVRIATLAPGALLWIHDVAETKGFYKANRLDVKKLQVADSPALVQAVASGSADVGISLGDVVIRAIDQNAPIIIAGGYLVKSSLRLVGAKDIKDIKQFQGTTMTAGAVRGGTTNMMLYQLKQHGVDPNTIQRVSIPNSRDRVLAMESGQVRGALMTPPFDVMASKMGMNILDVYEEPYLQTPLIVNTKWSGQNRDVAVRMLRASRSASEWLNDPANRVEAVALLAAKANVPLDLAEASYQFLVVEHKVYPVDLTVQDAAITNIFKIDRAINPADHPKDEPKVDVRKYYDPSYLSAK